MTRELVWEQTGSEVTGLSGLDQHVFNEPVDLLLASPNMGRYEKLPSPAMSPPPTGW